MSMMLNLVERLRAQGRKLQKLGLDREAARTWLRLARLREIPPDIAEEAQTSLAEIHIHGQRFARACRHLTLALTHQPHNPHLHFLLASAIESDKNGDPQRALEHYRQAIQLDPEHALYQCGFGLLALDLGHTEEALDSLRRALALAPDDPDVVGMVVEGVQQENPDEAQKMLRSALFRNPRDGRFRKLWSDFNFHVLRAQQQRARYPYPVQDGPTLLPFVMPDPSAKTDGKKVRRDSPSRPGRPHFPIHVSDKKHA